MKGSNKYLIDIKGTLFTNYSVALAELYTPICGIEAIGVYNLLAAEANDEKIALISRLCTLSKLNIDDFEQAIFALEKGGLLNTFSKKDVLLFVLKPPLTPKEFFEHTIYSRLYLNLVGAEQFEYSKALLVKHSLETEGFKEVTHCFDETVLLGWNPDNEEVYQSFKTNAYKDEKYFFDIRNFLRTLSEQVLPSNVRTDDNINIIAQLGSMFAISEDNMYKYLKRSMDYKKCELDIEGLRERCIKDKNVDNKVGEDQYDCSPTAFLYNKQNVPVCAADKRFLDYLHNGLNLSNEVINVLIDITLKNADNRFNRNYVEKVATEWIRQGVDTKEKALKASVIDIKKNVKKPDIVYTKDEMDVEEADIEAIRKLMYANARGK